MTEPSIVRDGDGGQWFRQADGKYNLRSSNAFVAATYQGYSLTRIRSEFGILGQTFDTPGGEQDYTYLRRA